MAYHYFEIKLIGRATSANLHSSYAGPTTEQHYLLNGLTLLEAISTSRTERATNSNEVVSLKVAQRTKLTHHILIAVKLRETDNMLPHFFLKPSSSRKFIFFLLEEVKLLRRPILFHYSLSRGSRPKPTVAWRYTQLFLRNLAHWHLKPSTMAKNLAVSLEPDTPVFRSPLSTDESLAASQDLSTTGNTLPSSTRLQGQIDQSDRLHLFIANLAKIEIVSFSPKLSFRSVISQDHLFFSINSLSLSCNYLVR